MHQAIISLLSWEKIYGKVYLFSTISKHETANSKSTAPVASDGANKKQSPPECETATSNMTPIASNGANNKKPRPPKRCAGCNEIKPPTEYSKNQKRKGALGRCKNCVTNNGLVIPLA